MADRRRMAGGDGAAKGANCVQRMAPATCAGPSDGGRRKWPDAVPADRQQELFILVAAALAGAEAERDRLRGDSSFPSTSRTRPRRSSPSRRRAGCRSCAMARSRSGNPWRSANISPRPFPRRSSGRGCCRARPCARRQHRDACRLRRAAPSPAHGCQPRPSRRRTAPAKGRARWTASRRSGAIAARRHGGEGPFLFGGFSIADAMFAPVATRFHTYGVTLEPDTAAYVETIMTCRRCRNGSRVRSANPGKSSIPSGKKPEASSRGSRTPN